MYEKIMEVKMVGISMSGLHFDWFYINTGLIQILTIFILLITIIMIYASTRLFKEKIKVKPELVYFMFFYPIIAPFWIANAVFSAFISKTITWR